MIADLFGELYLHVAGYRGCLCVCLGITIGVAALFGLGWGLGIWALIGAPIFGAGAGVVWHQSAVRAKSRAEAEKAARGDAAGPVP